MGPSFEEAFVQRAPDTVSGSLAVESDLSKSEQVYETVPDNAIHLTACGWEQVGLLFFFFLSGCSTIFLFKNESNSCQNI